MALSVLLVDDDPTFLSLAERIIKTMGAEVVATADDANGALAAANTTRADVAVVDVGLPDREGIDLAYQLAALPWSPRVVLVSTDSDAGSLNTIDALPVDQYVKGVIPNESPASWPQAALRAQAVAARSFALTGGVGGNGFDLYSDTRSQVYKGLSSETAATNQAAEATKGQVVMYGGKIAETFFSACSGGHTESVQNVFFGPPIPYLVGVPDPYDGACPLHSWQLKLSESEISSKLGSYLDGALKRVVVTQRGVSPRIVWAKLYGTGGVTKIRGDQLESALGAYSSWMNFQKLVNGKAAGGGEAEGEPSPPAPPGGVGG